MAIATSAAAILVLPIAGCGGGDSTIQSVSTTAATSSTTAVATDEFITAADARCAEANAAIANLSTDAAASSTAVQQQLDITKQTLSGLRALGEPEDPDGSLSDFYSATEDQISVLKQQQTALASGDTATFDSLGLELDQAGSDAETAAADFGLEDCGQQGSAISPGGTSTSTTPSPAAPVTPATTTPAPVAPVTPAPVAPVNPPPTGGTGTGTPPPTGGGGGSSGGISPTG